MSRCRTAWPCTSWRKKATTSGWQATCLTLTLRTASRRYGQGFPRHQGNPSTPVTASTPTQPTSAPCSMPLRHPVTAPPMNPRQDARAAPRQSHPARLPLLMTSCPCPGSALRAHRWPATQTSRPSSRTGMPPALKLRLISPRLLMRLPSRSTRSSLARTSTNSSTERSSVSTPTSSYRMNSGTRCLKVSTLSTKRA